MMDEETWSSATILTPRELVAWHTTCPARNAPDRLLSSREAIRSDRKGRTPLVPAAPSSAFRTWPRQPGANRSHRLALLPPAIGTPPNIRTRGAGPVMSHGHPAPEGTVALTLEAHCRARLTAHREDTGDLFECISCLLARGSVAFRHCGGRLMP